jgi:DNA-directed RNA polymerase specialized sigma24 family protein
MREELDHLLNRHLTPVYRLAIQLAPTLEDAADLTMLTFITASCSSHHDEMTVHGPRICLMRGVVRIFRSRHWSCRKGVVAGDEQARFIRPLGGHANPQQCDAPLDFSDEHLRVSIARLRPDFRAMLLLWSVEQFTDAQIAAVFDLPRRKTRSCLRRARLLLSCELRRVQVADFIAQREFGRIITQKGAA